jgi:hypothetical protein
MILRWGFGLVTASVILSWLDLYRHLSLVPPSFSHLMRIWLLLLRVIPIRFIVFQVLEILIIEFQVLVTLTIFVIVVEVKIIWRVMSWLWVTWNYLFLIGSNHLRLVLIVVVNWIQLESLVYAAVTHMLVQVPSRYEIRYLDGSLRILLLSYQA